MSDGMEKAQKITVLTCRSSTNDFTDVRRSCSRHSNFLRRGNIILASQFESFLHPGAIMLALPISIPFALLSLILLGQTLNIYSIFGMFMLFGIVKKNGILQVDYTNTLIAQGMERDKAILEANHTRLRPILMTTVTLIAGMIPIALGTGPGAASRASMAKVIIGGQALCLLLSLLVTPVAYSFRHNRGCHGQCSERPPIRFRWKKRPERPRAWPWINGYYNPCTDRRRIGPQRKTGWVAPAAVVTGHLSPT
jgi:hypothetical protein